MSLMGNDIGWGPAKSVVYGCETTLDNNFTHKISLLDEKL